MATALWRHAQPRCFVNDNAPAVWLGRPSTDGSSRVFITTPNLFSIFNDFQLSEEDSGRLQPGADKQMSDITQETVRLPATFAVKYLGKREARGLWGIKYTRKPVDDMVSLAKALKPGTSLPHLHFKVDVDGVTVSEMPDNRSRSVGGSFEVGFYSVDSISYGVQDLIYTRVFSMIVVKSEANLTPASLVSSGSSATPFECYAYVCDSRQR